MDFGHHFEGKITRFFQGVIGNSLGLILQMLQTYQTHICFMQYVLLEMSGLRRCTFFELFEVDFVLQPMSYFLAVVADLGLPSGPFSNPRSQISLNSNGKTCRN